MLSMDKFLSTVVNYCHSLDRDSLRDSCLIFPTRRACLIFRNQLAASAERTIWAPQVLSMRDFLVKLSGIQVASENELLLELFRVYKKHWKGVPFSRYHPWGKMLLNDFDEIDKQLIDAEKLFTGIKDLREIEQMFKPGSEELNWLKEFGSAFTPDQVSELQSSFMTTWQKLFPLYRDFREHLTKTGIAYEGMAYRNISQSLLTASDNLNHKRYIFSGLYGLTRSEESIISLIGNHRECRIFWDDDNYYVSDKDHEAGSYFRSSGLISDFPLPGNKALEETERVVNIISVPMGGLQGRYGGKMIGDMIDKGIENRSAVVLPDETLLPVLLNSIPDISGEINVTMGYPLEGGMIDSLFRQLYSLHTFGTRNQKGQIRFHFRYVMEVLRNPAVAEKRELSLSPHSGLYMSVQQISSYCEIDLAEKLFRELTTPADVFGYADEILDMMITSNGVQPKGGRLHQLSLDAVHSELKKLITIITPFIDEIDIHTAWQMITEMISSYRIPLSGEPVTGVQVMGFLETRALDFENLVILSMNDDKMPGKSHQNSYIPYSLRKTFGLHTRENRESMVAYNFYRLLQRAKSITLVYDSGDPQSGGEMSRYLLQLIHEFSNKHPNTSVTSSSLSLDLPPANDRVIEIAKTDQIVEQVGKRINEKYLSPSALSTFLKCSLRYYFRYVEGIREPEGYDGDIDHAKFGTILHELMKELYMPYEGAEISVTALKQMKEKITVMLPRIISEELNIDHHSLQGNNILKVGAIKILAERIIDHDITLAPFRIISLENEIIRPIRSGPLEFNIGGKLDRVDEVKGVTRIVDYKTGRVDISGAEKVDTIFSNPSKDKLLQLYLYHMLFKGAHPEVNAIAGFYEVRSITAGYLSPGNKLWSNEELMNEFHEKLLTAVSSLLDKDQPFKQTDDLNQCKYCHYKDICHR